MGSLATTKMPYTVRPLTASDMRSLVELGGAAFEEDELASLMFRRKSATPAQLEEFLSWRAEYRQKAFEKGSNDTIYVGAIDDATGQLIGATTWKKPQRNDAPSEEDKDDDSENTKKPEIMNVELVKEFEQFLKDAQTRHLGTRKDYYYLAGMSVHPSHQRKGIASRLLQQTLAEVDASGKDAFLEATPAGCPLYLRLGFEIVEEAYFKDEHKVIMMLRKARP